MQHADLMDLGDGLAVYVAAMADVIRSKTTVVRARQLNMDKVLTYVQRNHPGQSQIRLLGITWSL